MTLFGVELNKQTTPTRSNYSPPGSDAAADYNDHSRQPRNWMALPVSLVRCAATPPLVLDIWIGWLSPSFAPFHNNKGNIKQASEPSSASSSFIIHGTILHRIAVLCHLFYFRHAIHQHYSPRDSTCPLNRIYSGLTYTGRAFVLRSPAISISGRDLYEDEDWQKRRTKEKPQWGG